MATTTSKARNRSTRRQYPQRLRAFEKYDGPFLAALADAKAPVTSKELATLVFDKSKDFELARNARLWAASANWRGLIDSGNEPIGEQTFTLTPAGKKARSELS